MKTITKTGIGAAAALGLALSAGYALAHGGQAYGGVGGYPDMMGQGTGPGMICHSMGPGMMRHGMGAGTMRHGMGPGRGPCAGASDAEVSVESVRADLEKHLTLMGNPRLKVGRVEAEGENVIVAEVVTVDDSLVNRFEIDRATGRWQAKN